jgi:hypothetical protein
VRGERRSGDHQSNERAVENPAARAPSRIVCAPALKLGEAADLQAHGALDERGEAATILLSR